MNSAARRDARRFYLQRQDDANTDTGPGGKLKRSASTGFQPSQR